MAGLGVGTIGVAIRGDASSLTNSLARSALGIQEFERKAKASAKGISDGWNVGMTAAAVAILVVVASLGAATLAAAGFEQRMANVNSIVKMTSGQLATLSTSVLDISTRLPTSANTLAEGLYQIASSGFAGAEGLQVLEASATAASAGISTTKNAATAITAVLNAYGLSAASAADVSDALFQTVNYGVVEFDQLTGVIGDVVGMAAAAKVPIQDVGAAIATMTLSGISANEAGTSLNRLLQSLIQPSEALAGTYQRLGIESGTVALETLGLQGTMDKLRVATGGSVEGFLQLFPEIRAARGAFALASDEGKTYARVSGEMSDSNARLGSTQAALKEQMKATSNQWTVFTGTLNADAISLGTGVLPAVQSVLEVMQTLAENAIPTLNDGLAIVAPLLGTLKEAGVNVVAILHELYDATAPIAAGLASMVGAATLAGLTVLAESLKAVSGFLAEHPALIIAVAALWASRYLPSITAVASGLTQYANTARTSAATAIGAVREQILYQKILAQSNNAASAGAGSLGSTLGGVRQAAGTVTSAVGRMGAALVSSGLATAGLAIGIGLVAYAAQTAADGVKRDVDALTSGLTEFTGAQADEALAGLQSIRDGLDAVRAEQAKDGSVGWWNEFMGDKRSIVVNEAIADLNTKLANTTINLTAVSKATGLSVAELAKLQQAQGIDLTQAMGTEKALAGRTQLLAYIKDIEKQTGLSGDAMVNSVGNDIAAWEEFGKAVQAATDKAISSFGQATDVIGSWKPNIGVSEQEDALVRVADAQKALTEAQDEARKSADKKANSTPAEKADAAESSAKRIQTAQENLSDAQKKLQDADAKVAAGTLEATYKTAIETSRKFSEDLTTAVKMGLDPKIVSKLLEQGPEQAGPILEQLVSDHSGRMIEMVNESEKAIAAISAQVAEQARLTASAVNSTTDQMSKDLPKALDISSMAWAGSTARQIAEKMGLKPDEVLKIAKEFGITIADGIQQGIDSRPRPTIMSPSSPVQYQQTITSPSNPGYYNGGIYPGYTPGRDIGYIGISGGEAIMRPEWTRAVGPGFVDKMNAIARSGGVAAVQAAMGRYMGGFAGGGVAGAYQGSTRVVTVPVSTTIERNTPWTIQRAYFTDPAAAERFGDRSRARANRFGG